MVVVHCKNCGKKSPKNYVYSTKAKQSKFYLDHVAKGCQVVITKL
jgi:hypothetical protein